MDEKPLPAGLARLDAAAVQEEIMDMLQTTISFDDGYFSIALYGTAFFGKDCEVRAGRWAGLSAFPKTDGMS